MFGDFRIRICSDLDYEDLVADIIYKDVTIAIISQERGPNNMELESFSAKKNQIFPVDDFLGVIHFAKNELLKMKKVDD